MLIEIYHIIMFMLGCMAACVMDVIWFNINYSKYEKGFEVFEHYHIGIILGTIGLVTNQAFLLGIMMMLFVKESDQIHPFAHGSNHYKDSTLIGIGTFILFVAVLLVWMK